MFFVLLHNGAELLQPWMALDTMNGPRRCAAQSFMIHCIGLWERGISLRIKIANALNVCEGKAERMMTDGRCVREWDGVLFMLIEVL